MAIEPEPSSVTATLNYFTPPVDGEQPYNIVDPKEGQRKRNWESESQEVQIENLRGRENTVSLDTTGFQYGVHAAQHTAFDNDADIEREYYPESIALIKQVTGASRVVLFDHTIRRRTPGQADAVGKRQPAAQAHVDQSGPAARARVLRHLPAEDAPALLEKRFQIINLWRPIAVPAYDWPLALCDYRSVHPPTDLVPSRLIYPDREGETQAIKFNPAHKWKYVRGLRPEEYVLIKCHDSQENVAICTPHTAFSDPSTPDGAPLRQSIELRALVFYD